MEYENNKAFWPLPLPLVDKTKLIKQIKIETHCKDFFPFFILNVQFLHLLVFGVGTG